MKKILITIAGTLVVLILVAFIYISSGAYDVSQLTPHSKLTRSIIEMTKHRSIDKRMKEIVVPANLEDSAKFVTGFQHYNQMCLSCHGAPGQQPNEMAAGLYPRPPKLYKYAKKDDAQEFFWIIKNGIKMTSMPAFEPTHSDEKLWAITAFVTHKLGKMTPKEYNDWIKKYGGKDDDETTDDSK